MAGLGFDITANDKGALKAFKETAQAAQDMGDKVEKSGKKIEITYDQAISRSKELQTAIESQSKKLSQLGQQFTDIYNELEDKQFLFNNPSLNNSRKDLEKNKALPPISIDDLESVKTKFNEINNAFIQNENELKGLKDEYENILSFIAQKTESTSSSVKKSLKFSIDKDTVITNVEEISRSLSNLGERFSSLRQNTGIITEKNIQEQKEYYSELDNLRKGLEALTDYTRVEGDQNEKLSEQYHVAKKILKEVRQELNTVSSSINSVSESTAKYRTQISNIINEMTSLELAGKKESAQYKELEKELERLGTAYNKVNAQRKLLTTKGNENLAGIIQGISGVAGAFSAAQGVASLFVKNNEQLAAIQTKLQAAMSITIGLQQVSSTLHSTSAFRISTVTKATQLWNNAVKALNVNLGISQALSKGLLSLGITALIAGITYLIKKQKEWNKQQEETKRLNKIVTDGLKESAIEGGKSAQKEITSLNLLYKATQNENKSRKERLSAVKELQTQYPAYFKNLSKEEILAGKGATAYNKLATSIIAASKARAAADKITENQSKILDLEAQRQKAEDDLIIAESTYAKQSARSADARVAQTQENTQLRTQARIDDLKDTISTIDNEIKAYNEASEKLADSINIDELLFTPKTDDPKTIKAQESVADKLINKSLEYQKKIDAARIASIQNGAEKEREAIAAEYRQTQAFILNELREIEKLEKITRKPATEQRNELSALDAAATANYEAALQRLKDNNIKAIESIFSDVRQRFDTELNNNLNGIQSYYDELVTKAKEAGASIEQINQLYLAREKESEKATLSSQINKINYNEELELIKAEGSKAAGMTELNERKRLEITKKYAEQRLAVLRQLSLQGDEQATKDLRLLEENLKNLDVELQKPKTIKLAIDTKVFDKIKEKYLSLGQTEEQANLNTENFFKAFTDGGEVAADVLSKMQGLFGSMNEELDMALDAALKIAEGFATGGGLVGGIEAAASQLIAVTIKLMVAKKEVDKSMIEGYEAYIEAIDRLIDKQIKSLESLGAVGIRETLNKTVDDLNNKLEASRRLFNEVADSGSGLFSRSLGYKANKMLRDYSGQLQQAGIYTTDIYKMTNEQLIKLRSMPEVWAHLHGDLRKYIDDMADASEELEGINDQLKDIIIGLDYSTVTDAIVDSLTDSSIDDAMGTLEGKVDDMISNIIKNIITKNMLVEPIQKMISQLWDTIEIKENEITFDPEAMQSFKNQVLQQANAFKNLWDGWEKTFADLGIDFNKPDETANERTSAAKGIANISQDSANELNGNFYALLISSAETRNIASEIRALSAEGLLLLKIMNNDMNEMSDVFRASQDIFIDQLNVQTRIERNTLVAAQTLEYIRDNGIIMR